MGPFSPEKVGIGCNIHNMHVHVTSFVKLDYERLNHAGDGSQCAPQLDKIIFVVYTNVVTKLNESIHCICTP